VLSAGDGTQIATDRSVVYVRSSHIARRNGSFRPNPQAPMLSFPHSDQYKHFVAELRAAREEAGLSQAELAARLAVDRTVITKAEGGVRRLDLIELRAWLIALDVELLAFVGRLEDRLERHAEPTQPSRARRGR
jgi:ribosome-binding protein aMBF1 (putative translation factor)